MPIMLTCSCGQQQYVANERAGRTLACVGCGQAIAVPAMGVLANSKAKTKPAAKPVAARSSRMGVLLVVVGGVLLMFGVGSGIAWKLSQRVMSVSEEVVAKHVPSPPAPLPDGEGRKTAPPPVIEPKKLEPTKPTNVIDPVEPPPAKVEPVKPVVEPVKPIVEPIKPKVDPPKEPLPPPLVVEKKPNLMEPLRLVWKLKEVETFYQELTVTQNPTFKVQGIPIVSMLRYRVVSRFTVKKANADGSLVVEQKVESAKLLQADALTQNALAGPVARLPGTTYTMHLGPKTDVTKLDGAADAIGVAALGGQGMQMASLLDRDGWKEIAQTTFFQMDKPLKVNDRWLKPMTHNWGSLGSWSGQTHFVYMGQQGTIHNIAFGQQMAYKAPAAGAAIGGMKITGAQFQPQEARGVIAFDAARGKVVSAEERFRVKGVLNGNLLGYEIAILGTRGIDPSDSEKRYTLKSLPRQFSGVQLLCIMYVAFKRFAPDTDTGFDVTREALPQKRRLRRNNAV